MSLILRADDDDDIRDLLSMTVASMGHTPHAVADGLTALEALSTSEYDLALLDVSMPGATRLEIVALVRSVDPHHELPLVLISAHSRPIDVTRGINAGADLYLTKPVSIAALRTHITALLTAPHGAINATPVSEAVSVPTPPTQSCLRRRLRTQPSRV